MLIGIDASRANREHKSGTEWYSYYLIREIAKLDDKNQYILYTDEPLKCDLMNLCFIDENEKITKPQFDKDGYQIIRSPHNNFKAKVLKWPLKFLWTQGRLSFEVLFNRPDVLFIPSHTLPLIHPKNSIITIHDVGFERDKKLYLQQSMGPEYKFYRRVLNLLVRFFTRGRYGANIMDYYTWSTIFALKKAKQIITVSNFTKKEIIDIYSPELGSKLLDKIKVIYNGYPDELYKQIDDYEKIESILEKYDIEPPFMLYVGRLERKKNTPSLVEAFGLMQEKNKEYNLVLAGDASFGYDEVRYMVSEYDLDDKVIKTGWLEEADLPYIYNAASAFVFPSLYEGFGIPLLQAAACGVPIAASNAASIPEVLGNAAEYFNPLDTYSMAEAMLRITTDPELREKLIGLGLSRCKDFSWKKTAEKTLEVIMGMR